MKQYTILVVDDQPDNLKIIADYIQEAGSQYSILKAPNGKFACQIAEDRIPDLIITDWEMPEMDGIEVIKYLKSKETTKDIPVIMATGIMLLPQNLKMAFESGAIDYIRKPIDKTELIARVSSMLQLSDSYKEIKLLNATKDKFLSIITHDLKEPFNVLVNFSQTLYEEYDKLDNENIKQLIELLYNNSTITFRLLQNLLTWSRLQRDKIDYYPDRLIINFLIAENIELMKPIADKKGITLESEISETVFVTADQNMTTTVIRNLLNNAIKFTQRNGTITIGCRNIDNAMTETYISDTGVGISEANKAKLFRIDEDFSTHGTDKEAGTGLGLILCKDFIEKNKGKLSVESTEGKGSTFRFTLPVK